MRQFLLAIISLVFFSSHSVAQQIYFENFEGEAIGATTGTAVGGTWSTTYGGSGTFSKQVDLSYGNVFQAANLDAEAVWQTDVVATSGTVVIDVGFIATGNNVNAGDYLRFYYKLDGGSETLFYQLTGADVGTETSSPILTVTTSIQIVARVNNADPLDLFLADDRFVFDNVAITKIQTLYSRADNVSWNASGTWSTTSHAGASCACTPNEYSSVIIGDNDRINLTANQDVYSVYIANTGTLRYTASTIDLNLLYGGGFTVENGGSYLSNGQTTVQLELESEYDYTITNNGTFSISDIIVNAGSNVTVSGSGALTLSGDFELNDAANVTFSTSGAVTVSTSLDINNDNAAVTVTFNNSGTFTTPLIDIGVATTINFNNSAAITVSNDINVDEDATFNFNNSVAVSVTDDLLIVSGDPLTINGTGQLNIGDDITLDDNLFKNGSGTIAVTDRIYFTDAEILDLNAGTITAAQIYFDGDLASINNTGTITLSGDIVANGTTDDDNTIIIDNGAVLTFVNLDGTVATSGSNDGGELNINNSGTINQSGNFLDIAAGSDMNNLATGIWNWSMVANSGFDISINTTATLDLTTVGNTFNFTGGTGTQTLMNKVYHHVGLSGIDAGGTNVVKRFSAGATPDFNGNITITEEAQFDINTNDISFTVGGNFTMSGTNPDPFLDGNGSAAELVTFDGSGDQTLTSPAAGETFQRLRVNKPSGDLILVNNLTIRNYSGSATEVFLTQGRIMTSSTSLLILSDDVTTSGGDADSYVDGPMRKDGNDSFTFPVGDGAVFARIAISAPGSTQSFTAEYFNDAYTDLTADNTIDHVSGYEYWSLTSTGGSAQVTLYWESSTNSEITNNADLRIARYGTQWSDVGSVTASGTTSGTIQMNSATSTFGLFTFASETGINPLPITLTSFSAQVEGTEVVTHWVTSMEINNDFFTVEKSVDAETFTPVAVVKGKGNSYTENYYSTVDEYPYSGRSYYRLKQTDFDGKVSYSALEAVNYDGPSHAGIRVYPNPSTGSPVTLELVGEKLTGSVPVEIFNEKGQKVLEFQLDVKEGQTSVQLPLNGRLPNGIYILRANRNYRLTRKIVIN
jgi:hypothetical protein